MKGTEYHPYDSASLPPQPPAVSASSLIFSSSRKRNRFNALKTLLKNRELGGLQTFFCLPEGSIPSFPG